MTSHDTAHVSSKRIRGGEVEQLEQAAAGQVEPAAVGGGIGTGHQHPGQVFDRERPLLALFKLRSIMQAWQHGGGDHVDSCLWSTSETTDRLKMLRFHSGLKRNTGRYQGLK